MGDPDPNRTRVENASRGDVTAIEALLEHHLPGLRNFVRRRAPGVVAARESSSDLVQSVCREVLEHLADERLEYRGEAEFKKWLYQAALNKLQNRRRYHLAEKRDPGREVTPRAARRLVGRRGRVLSLARDAEPRRRDRGGGRARPTRVRGAAREVPRGRHAGAVRGAGRTRRSAIGSA